MQGQVRVPSTQVPVPQKNTGTYFMKPQGLPIVEYGKLPTLPLHSPQPLLCGRAEPRREAPAHRSTLVRHTGKCGPDWF